MTDNTKILTNTAAATRLRTLLHQLTREPPAQSPRLIQEEQLRPHGIPMENP